MCGRLTQKAGELPGLVTTMSDDALSANASRSNSSPGQDHSVIRRRPSSAENPRDHGRFQYA